MDQLAVNVASSAWSQFVATQAAKSALALVYAATKDIQGSINLSHGTSAASWLGAAANTTYDMRTVTAVAVFLVLVGCAACACAVCAFGVICCCVGAVARDAIGSAARRILPRAGAGGDCQWDVEAAVRRPAVAVRDSLGSTVQGLAAVANSITIGGNSAVGEVAQQLGVDSESVTEWWLTWQRAVRGPKRQQ